MALQLGGSVHVDGVALAFGDDGRRLDFPKVDIAGFHGVSGATPYQAEAVTLTGLAGRLEQGRWQAQAAAVRTLAIGRTGERLWLRADVADFPSGLAWVRAAGRASELITPQLALSETTVEIVLPGPKPSTESQPPGSTATPRSQDAAASEPLRQARLGFLDGLTGEIRLTIHVELDLPVIGRRSLNQALTVPIRDGCLDFRALDKSLDWLEGTFLAIEVDGARLVLAFSLPIVGSTREIAAWHLDAHAQTLAKFGRVPVRCLFDLIRGKPSSKGSGDKRRAWVRSFRIEDIDFQLSLLAPRHLDVGAGAIMFGGEDANGIVDLKVTGAVRQDGPGALRGRIGALDTTLKDIRLGTTHITVDRLHIGNVEQFAVTFDGLRATRITGNVDALAATNLAIVLGA